MGLLITLDISTAHLPPCDREVLEATCELPCLGQLSHGYLLWVPVDDVRETMQGFMERGYSPAMINLLNYARGIGALRVQLDQDGDIWPGLPTFDDEGNYSSEEPPLGKGELPAFLHPDFDEDLGRVPTAEDRASEDREDGDKEGMCVSCGLRNETPGRDDHLCSECFASGAESESEEEKAALDRVERGGMIVNDATEKATEEEIEQARETFTADDVSIDDDAIVIHTPDAFIVQAWVRIAKEAE
jgi:hypothetical protein